MLGPSPSSSSSSPLVSSQTEPIITSSNPPTIPPKPPHLTVSSLRHRTPQSFDIVLNSNQPQNHNKIISSPKSRKPIPLVKKSILYPYSL